jgi:Domain of unknown function (DUF3303)
MALMRFMVIERFKSGNVDAVGERFRRRGRLMPEGVAYIASWLDPAGTMCFQLMEATDRSLLDVWIDAWRDLVDFDVTPVQPSAEFWAARQGGSTGE